jgi:orc1/cdc6 family replication initiation protein
MSNNSSVVTKPELLHENHFPADIKAREPQINELSDCLRPAIKKMKPMHAWIYGKPGTGKTLVARHVLRKLEKEACVNGVYINCWEHNSYYSVLDKLVRELRILGAEKLNTSFKLERFQQFVGKKPFVIVLDEIDQAKGTEKDAIIYNLCNIGNIGLVCISNSREVLYSLDERIKSRLNAKQIEFKPYDESDLYDILKERADIALQPGSLSGKTLKHIARFAEGDARAAIQVLKNAAYCADNDCTRTIELMHVKEGHNSSKDLEKSYLLNRLNSHQRLLYELVKEKKVINSGELWAIYLESCMEKQPIAVRTFSEYMNILIEMSLVQWDRALVKGKVRVFSVSD